MILLSLTTSTDRGGLALFKDKKLLKEKSWTRKMGQSEAVTQALAALLKTHKLVPKDICGIVLDIGPGSFTGCRISANLAKTLAQSLNIKIHSVTSLEALLFQNPKSDSTLAVIDAHKSLYYCMGKKAEEISSLELLDQEAVSEKIQKGTLVVGVFPKTIEAVAKSKKAKLPTKKILHYPSAQTLGRMFFKNFKGLKEQDWKHVEPLYVRSPQK